MTLPEAGRVEEAKRDVADEHNPDLRTKLNAALGRELVQAETIRRLEGEVRGWMETVQAQSNHLLQLDKAHVEVMAERGRLLAEVLAHKDDRSYWADRCHEEVLMRRRALEDAAEAGQRAEAAEGRVKYLREILAHHAEDCHGCDQALKDTASPATGES